MGPVPIFRGKVHNGRILFENRDGLNAHISSLEGREIEIVVRKQRVQRSVKQNAYYFGVVIPIFATYTGYGNDEMHEVLKWRFLRIADEHGMETTRSTADLTTEEFTAYVDSVKQFAREMGVHIPNPGDAE